MVDKKPTADNWPVVSGDYIVGDPESPVAVTTLASHNEDIPAAAGAAIAGPCKTENLGIEKDPGALEEDALVIDLDEKNSESAKVFMYLKNDDVKIDNEA